MSVKARPGLSLYRQIMKNIRRLPPNEQTYYYNFTKTHFVQHMDEQDEERINQIISRGRQDMIWVLRKYFPEDEIEENQEY